MTDRLKGVTVVFDHDIRTDDAEPIINAIRCLRGVLAVAPSLKTSEDFIIRERVRHELGQKILAVIYPDLKKADNA